MSIKQRLYRSVGRLMGDLGDLSEDDQRAVRGWCLYDWANSAFSTSITVAILPIYFAAIFTSEYHTGGPDFLGFNNLPAETLWAWTIGLSAFIVAVTSPVLGVIADRAPLKMWLLRVYASAGALFTFLLLFSAYTGHDWAWLLGCFFLANVGFAGSTVFYNALLPHIVKEEYYDDVSSRGYAYGYIGGGLLLLFHLIVLIIFDYDDLVTRLALASVGLWWYGWSLYTFATIPEPHVENPLPNLGLVKATKMAFSELRQTFGEISSFKILFTYLIAFILFNDGIQTVLAQAGVYAVITLGVTSTTLIATILIIQFVGALGATVFKWLAELTSSKQALMYSLVVWVVVIILATGFAIEEPSEKEDFDYQLTYNSSNTYLVEAVPALGNGKADLDWIGLVGDWDPDDENKNIMQAEEATFLVEQIETGNGQRFSLYYEWELASQVDFVIGPEHPSQLGDEELDAVPIWMRSHIWGPLGLSADLQFLLVGAIIGLVMGGSQALARSIFASMTPNSRSFEFFGFFGVSIRVSTIFGPLLYGWLAFKYDARVGVLSLAILVVLGALLFLTVDVDEGRRVAIEEEKKSKSVSESSS